MDAKDFLRLKDEAEALTRKEERLKGQLDGLLVELKDRHGCPDVKSAQRLLKKLEAEAAGLEREYEEALKEYRDKWEGNLT